MNLIGAQENETIKSNIGKPNMKRHLTEECEKEWHNQVSLYYFF